MRLRRRREQPEHDREKRHQRAHHQSHEVQRVPIAMLFRKVASQNQPGDAREQKQGAVKDRLGDLLHDVGGLDQLLSSVRVICGPNG